MARKKKKKRSLARSTIGGAALGAVAGTGYGDYKSIKRAGKVIDRYRARRGGGALSAAAKSQLARADYRNATPEVKKAFERKIKQKYGPSNADKFKVGNVYKDAYKILKARATGKANPAFGQDTSDLGRYIGKQQRRKNYQKRGMRNMKKYGGRGALIGAAAGVGLYALRSRKTKKKTKKKR